MARVLVSTMALAMAALALADAASSSSSAALESSSGSSSVFADIPLCDQDELIEVADIMTTNARKLQCQEELGVSEMVTVSDPLTLCTTACLAALEVLYSTLPQCRYKDWPIQYECELLLENCGVTPVNITASSYSGSLTVGASSDGSTSGTADAGDSDSATTWNVSSSASSSAFAPVGVTPSPTTATPTPTPTDSSATSIAASVALSAVTVFAVASVL
jgi:hypothetical protein